MLTAYPACFFKEEDGYSVIFPDLNYLATCGDTLDEAFAMAVDCLAGYIYSCRRDGDAVPAPSKLGKVCAADVAKELELEQGESFVNMITVDVDEYAKAHFEKSVKKTLTVPMWLNDMAIDAKINFSQTLQEALKTRLGV